MPPAFVPALPLGREEQERLVRFLAGRSPAEPVQAPWQGAFAPVAALRPLTAIKE